MTTAQTYVRKIRNPHKRQYAESFLAYCLNGGPYPARPPELSFMGMQAVEIALRDLLKQGGNRR